MIDPPIWVRRAVIRANAGACYYCGGQATAADHIVPRAFDGGHGVENLIASCPACNFRKGKKRLPAPDEAAALAAARVLAPHVLAGTTRDDPLRGSSVPGPRQVRRKLVPIPNALLWAVREFRHKHRIASENEAFELLIVSGLRDAGGAP